MLADAVTSGGTSTLTPAGACLVLAGLCGAGLLIGLGIYVVDGIARWWRSGR